MSFKDWLINWFKHSDKPVAAEVVIKGSAAALEEAAREIVRLDSKYTKKTAYEAIVSEYDKRQKN